jgi:hypothetical protein
MITQPGLLYVTACDPLSRCLQNFTQSKYTAYGFYLPTTISGSWQDSVYIYDQLGRMAPLWSDEETTLEALQANPYVTGIIFRSVSSGAEHFRAAVFEVLQNNPVHRQPQAVIQDFVKNPPRVHSDLQQKVLDRMQEELRPVTKNPEEASQITLALLDASIDIKMLSRSQPPPIDRTVVIQLMASAIDLFLAQPDLVKRGHWSPDTYLYTLTSNLVRDINTGLTPALDINKLISITNSLHPHATLIPPLQGEASYPATITVNTPGDTSGGMSQQDIILTTHGSELGLLSVEQLRAVARELDMNEGANPRFDKLRAKVAAHLAELTAHV